MAKYQAYAEYKDSGVEWLGKFPSHWNQTYLKYVVLINMGQSPSSEDCNIDGIGIPFLQGNAEFGTYSPTAKNYCPIPKKIADKGDLLFSVRAPVGALNYADMQYGIGRGLCSLKSRSSINSSFLWWVLPTYKYQLDAIATGSTFEAVSAEEVANLKFPLPTIVEQQKIANFLDHETAQIDTLIAKQEKLIELLKEKRQAVISHAVTKGLDPNVPMKDSGVAWLGEVPEHWIIPKLFHITNKIGDGLHSTPIYEDGTGYYFINGNNLVDGKISITETAKEVPFSEYLKHKVELNESSVLLSINGTIGKVALYANEPVILGKSAAYINCKISLEPSYLACFLVTSQAKKYYDLEVTGTTIYNLSLNSIRNFRIPLPSRSEQLKIVDFVRNEVQKYESLIGAAQQQMTLLGERRTALISAAVTGKIDVRNWQAPTLAGAQTELSA